MSSIASAERAGEGRSALQRLKDVRLRSRSERAEESPCVSADAPMSFAEQRKAVAELASAAAQARRAAEAAAAEEAAARLPELEQLHLLARRR
jgi:predicted GNAT superfamily acetyltransferase